MDWGVWYWEADDAWAYTQGAGTKFMSISSGHEQGHVDLPAVPTNNCGGQFGGCDDGPYRYTGTHALGHATERWNGIGWIGVAPGVAPSDTYSWGACEHSQDFITCHTSQIAAGLDAARLAGVKVAFMGHYSPNYDATLATAVANAWQYGDILMVAPAGNLFSGGPQVPGQAQYPAAHDHVLGVSGIKPDSSFAGPDTCGQPGAGVGSQYGSHVDVAAAFYTTSTWGGGSYASVCDTNASGALVAGLAALMRAYRPGDDADAVARGIKNSAGPLGDPAFFGAGFPNALTAVSTAPPPPAPALTASIWGPTKVRPNVNCSWQANVSGGHPPYAYRWYKNGGGVGTDAWVTIYTDTGSFWLDLYVVDSWNGQSGQTIFVTNTSSAPECLS